MSLKRESIEPLKKKKSKLFSILDCVEWSSYSCETSVEGSSESVSGSAGISFLNGRGWCESESLCDPAQLSRRTLIFISGSAHGRQSHAVD